MFIIAKRIMMMMTQRNYLLDVLSALHVGTGQSVGTVDLRVRMHALRH